MSYIDTFKKYRLNESNEYDDNTNLVDDEQDDWSIDDDELDEMSVAAGAGGYQTPYAFGNLSDDDIETLGYKKVKKVKKESKDSDFVKLSKALHLNEISYHAYKKDTTTTPKHKINTSINHINKGLREIEKIVNRNVRLKQETGVNNTMYWKSSRENLTKIRERLNRVSKQLKELAS
jgi:chaperonin cofactor prefoldin